MEFKYLVYSQKNTV